MEEDKITKMIKDNRRLVYYCYNRLKQNQQWWFYKDELIGEGFLGLYKGCSTYDETKGYSLSTYLTTCINNQMKMFFRKFRKEPESISLETAFTEDDNGDTLTLNNIVYNPFNIEKFDVQDYVDIYFKHYNKNKHSEKTLPVIIKMLSEGYMQIDIVKRIGISQPKISRYVTKLKNAIIKEREKDVKRSRVE